MNKEIPFKFDQSSDLGRWRAETFWEKEPETIAWLESFQGLHLEQLDFVDIGANLGIYSLFALTTGAYSRVIAVEPMPLNFNALKTNIKLNELEDKAILYNQPLYSHTLMVNFEFNDERVGSSGGQVVEDPSNTEKINTAQVQTLTGDDLIEANQIKQCVIKLDVDGLELEILKGFKKSLSKNLISSILVEATIHNKEEIEYFLNENSFYIDNRFDILTNHSTVRRTVSGSSERNLIFSKLPRS